MTLGSKPDEESRPDINDGPSMHRRVKAKLAPLDLYGLRWAADPQISLTGEYVAYMRTRADLTTDCVRRCVVCIRVASGDSTVVVEEVQEPSSPRWSPDGVRIGVITRVGGKATLEVVEVATRGKVQFELGEIRPRNFVWSPDGRSIALRGAVFGLQGDDSWTLPHAPVGASWAPRPIVVSDVPFRHDEEGWLPQRTNLFRLVVSTGAISPLTTGMFDDAPDGVFDWTPDGASVVFAGNREGNRRVRARATCLYSVGADGAITRITDSAGSDYSPRIAPDGKTIAYLRHPDIRAPYLRPRLMCCNRRGSEARDLTDTFDYPVRQIEWAMDGSGLFALADRRGRTTIAYFGLDGSIRTLVDAVGGGWVRHPYLGGSFTRAADGTLAYGSCHEDRPPDVEIRTPAGEHRLLTALNTQWAGVRDLGRMEELTATTSTDRPAVHGWLLLPPGFDRQRRYPLILDIHGGPWADFAPQFSIVSHLYAAAGYVVLFANPRGSTSYGEAFATAINQSFPGCDYDDLMSMVDAALATGFVDSENMFLVGASAGGVLTTWTVGTTQRFRAACSVKPYVNCMSWALTLDEQGLYIVHSYFPSEPWLDPERLWRLSPLSRAHLVTTPTMLICGEQDLRTPVGEAEQFFSVLVRRHVPTVLVRLPGTNHVGGRPSHWLAHALYTLDWFDRYRRDDAQRTPTVEHHQ